VKNLFADLAVPTTGERFETLCASRAVVVERIVSSAEPVAETYDQGEDEWVALLRGEAELEVEGAIVRLKPGDHLLLPAHTRHSVRRASAGAVWLAVHIHPTEPGRTTGQLR
jgi:cupin 2 domain-containing protein